MPSEPGVKVIINGIDLSRSQQVKHSIAGDGDGDVARPRYEASVAWQEGYVTEATVNGPRTILGDEPAAYGGRSKGLSPQDLLLTAVGNCLAATYVGGLSANGITIRSLLIHVSGRVNFKAAFGVEAGSPGFESIDVRVDIETDEPGGKVEALLQKLFPTAPIPDTILRPVPINLVVHHT